MRARSSVEDLAVRIRPSRSQTRASGGINEVEALRSVFFKFFNIQTKGINLKKKKTDIVSQEVNKFPINPFFDDTLQTFSEKSEKNSQLMDFNSAAKVKGDKQEHS